jgi:hypothetical protein
MVVKEDTCICMIISVNRTTRMIPCYTCLSSKVSYWEIFSLCLWSSASVILVGPQLLVFSACKSHFYSQQPSTANRQQTHLRTNIIQRRHFKRKRTKQHGTLLRSRKHKIDGYRATIKEDTRLSRRLLHNAEDRL